MTHAEIAAACLDAIARGHRHVKFTLPRQPSGRAYGIRLTPRSGPVGEVYCVNSEGNTVAGFDPQAVLRWVLARSQRLRVLKNIIPTPDYLQNCAVLAWIAAKGAKAQEDPASW